MPRRTHLNLTLILLALLPSVVWAEDASVTRRRPAPTPATAPSEGGRRYIPRQLDLPSGPIQPTRLELTILQLNCSTGVLAGIEIDRLTAGHATPPTILEHLQQYGKASIIFRVDSVTNLPAGTKITQGSRVPTVQDIVISRSGVATPSVTYEKVGAIVEIRGQWREDDPQTADVAAEIEVSSLTETPIRVASGVTLPGFGQLDLKQTLEARNGITAYYLLNGNPTTNGTESVSTVHLICLRLTRTDQLAPSAQPTNATTWPPQTLIEGVVYEVTGEKEKLSQINLGTEPPTNDKQIEEKVGWFGKIAEISRPSILANWPSQSTITIGTLSPVNTESDAGQLDKSVKSIISTQRTELTITLEGQWSNDDPEHGHLKVEVDQKQRRRSSGRRTSNPCETVILLRSEVDIQDNTPCCVLSEVITDRGDDTQARRYVMRITAKRIVDVPAKPDQSR